ncbi:MAG: PBSX family phage terminase large subunit [Cyanobacteria bacterium P01_D01_bin.36]
MVALSTRPSVDQVELKVRNKVQSCTNVVPLTVIEALEAEIVSWAKPLLKPYRYKCLFGGRGSGKSFATADALLITGLARTCRVLCAREFQNSLSESVHQLLCDRIEALGISEYYQIYESKILGPNGTEFFFKGLRHNVRSLKSIPGITHVWIEEASSTSASSWKVLVPTIRDPGSEIWLTFNPDQKTDPVYQAFVEHPEQLAGESYIQQVNWRDNPYFPEELELERQAMLASDPDLYQHVYEGQCWERSEAQVLIDKWGVEEFEPGDNWDGPYHGADWGFAADPTALVKVWVHENRLYVERESVAVRLELEHTADRWKIDVPGCDRYVIRADCARPESISHVSRSGIPRLIAAPKWQGSVEDGIAHLRSYDRIIIHPRCKTAINEARLWRYKVDPLTEDVLPVLVKSNDHIWDGVRYALSELIQKRLPLKRKRVRAVSNW